MYVYIYIYIYICIYTKYTSIHIYIYTICVSIYNKQLYVNVYIYIHIYIYICVCIHSFVTYILLITICLSVCIFWTDPFSPLEAWGIMVAMRAPVCVVHDHPWAPPSEMLSVAQVCKGLWVNQQSWGLSHVDYWWINNQQQLRACSKGLF